MLAPGTTLRDSYTIVRLIAQGGMGAVYLAKHQRLGSTVAVKETFFNDPSMLKAFEREARLLAGLRHGALPKVIDHFSEGDGWFLVMEFIGGDDFAEILKQRGGAFPINQVMDWGDQLLSALEYLHKQTPPVIHRDIKPHNLKLTQEGQIVLLDFGLAKGQVEGMSRMTAGHSIQGYTPAYAPLEQIQGAGTDARSDLYSLAATLYHLMTGFTPADALSRAAVVVIGQPDPLRSAHALNPEVPQRVADVLMHAMSQNRDQRQAGASEMRRMLRDAAGNDQPTVVTPVAPRTGETIAMVSERQKDSDSPIINRPSPAAVNLSIHKEQPDNLAARTEWDTDQPERATSPRPVPTTDPTPLLQGARKWNRPWWMTLGIVAMLIIGIVFFPL
ncbi:MAG: protein kinase [Acidobacteriota bacterium]